MTVVWLVRLAVGAVAGWIVGDTAHAMADGDWFEAEAQCVVLGLYLAGAWWRDGWLRERYATPSPIRTGSSR